MIDPTQASTLKAGDHQVYFPANSICDPATSGYGEDMWDQPCEPLTQPITIHATWNSKYGHAFIDFQPALRFVPTSDPSHYVTIAMKDYYDLDAFRQYTIFWNRPSDDMWVDESANDPSMSTITDLNGNRISRRLKHFSGYNIIFGAGCDPNVEDCSSQGGMSKAAPMPMNLFSGYITTVGLSEQGREDNDR